MVTNLKHFKKANINRVEEPVLVLFGDNKAFIQLEKGISNIRKIKHIDIEFHKFKDKSVKDTMLL